MLLRWYYARLLEPACDAPEMGAVGYIWILSIFFIPRCGAMASQLIADAPKRLLLVTGGSRGIGRSVCALAARNGWAVAVNYRSDAVSATSIVDEIVSSGGRAKAFQADVSQEPAVRAAHALLPP